ncbi:hypothetical protein EVAR_52794_1 [Eumeta japonica]|uniref:Uncharacterized protein n=1 Tax=Eumeta variegata TaxID=151549 RepID=A0A4C1Y522_EUMVA|nr:hypothetical protein EVAR_52794_1 [Eumeta japonica]
MAAVGVDGLQYNDSKSDLSQCPGVEYDKARWSIIRRTDYERGRWFKGIKSMNDKTCRSSCIKGPRWHAAAARAHRRSALCAGLTGHAVKFQRYAPLGDESRRCAERRRVSPRSGCGTVFFSAGRGGAAGTKRGESLRRAREKRTF